MEISTYFSVISTTDRVLHAEMKQFWAEDVMEEIGPRFLEQFHAAVDSFDGAFVVLADLSKFRAMTPPAKEYLNEAMIYAQQNGLHRAVEIAPRVPGKFGSEPADSHLGIVVRDMQEAQDRINEIKAELEPGH